MRSAFRQLSESSTTYSLTYFIFYKFSFIMEVKNENSALLSNLEVFMLLKDIQSGKGNQQKPNKFQQNLATITYETVKYLERTPCGLQDMQKVAAFMQAVKSYNLTKAEKLQLLNQRPSSAVEIQLMIEESEERLTEEQIYQLLNLIATHLPGPEPETQPLLPQEDGQAEEAEGMDEDCVSG